MMHCVFMPNTQLCPALVAQYPFAVVSVSLRNTRTHPAVASFHLPKVSRGLGEALRFTLVRLQDASIFPGETGICLLLSMGSIEWMKYKPVYLSVSVRFSIVLTKFPTLCCFWRTKLT